MSGKVKIGVIGLGNMGNAHLTHVKNNPSLELTAVCDLKKELVEDRASKFGAKPYTDAEAMMKSGDVQAVIIATPHYDHTPLAISAFRHGLHVLTEKPIAVHKNDAAAMIEEHRKFPNLVFSAMFQQRTDPVFAKLKELIDSDEFGKITRVSWIVTSWFRSQCYYNSGGWRATWRGEGGGVLLNQCPHNIDLFQWFFGVPDKVRATCSIGKYHDIEVEDEVTAYMEYKNGLTAVFITSTGEAPGTNRLEITCERGKVLVENGKMIFTRNVVPTSVFRKTTTSLFGQPETWEINVPTPGTPPAHQKIVDNFADAILNGAKLIAPAEEGIKSVEIANSMLYSSMNSCDVNLPLDGDKYEAMLEKLIAGSKFVKQEAAAKTNASDFAGSFNKV